MKVLMLTPARVPLRLLYQCDKFLFLIKLFKGFPLLLITKDLQPIYHVKN